MVNELLTVEEFAQKIKVGRSTLFDWVNKGILVRGRHYFKIGRILRFTWSEDIVGSLTEAAIGEKTSLKLRKKKSIDPGIDWDY